MEDESIDVQEQKRVLAEQDLADEVQIKFAMLNFYETASSLTPDNIDDKIHVLRAQRNVIKNMMWVYLSKFNNQLILDEFQKALNKTREESIEAGKLHYYPQFMKEMRVIGTFLGIRENISGKLSEQLLNAMMEEKTLKGDDPDGC